MNPICKYMLCLLGLLTPMGILADDEAPAEFSGHTWYEYRDQSFSVEGKGTLLNPIVINTPEELAQLSYLVNTQPSPFNTFKNKVVVLGADINLEKTVDGQRVQWIPIGHYIPFYGVFLGINTKAMGEDGLSSGQRHTISGMYINIGASDAANITGRQTGYYGLFGRSNGYIGHVNLTNATLSVDFSGTSLNFWAGLLSGLATYSTNTINESDAEGSKSITSYSVIDAVSVSGSLTVTSNPEKNSGVGGITGANENYGILHSSSDVSISATDCKYVGGITGDEVGTGRLSIITDCASNAVITSTNNGLSAIPMVGGIAGSTSARSYISIYACSATGSVNSTGDHFAGGICGNILNTFVYSCASMVSLSGNGYLGGILGHFPSSLEDEVKCCTYGAHIDGSQATYAGGFCGSMECTDNTEHINGCVFTGTMTPTADAANYSVTVGKGNEETIEKNITFCYYDNQLYSGNVAPGMAEKSSFSVKGLTTENLTSANTAILAYLPIEEGSTYGFKLTKGYYPEVYGNDTSKEPGDDYYTLQGENSEEGLNEVTRQLFCSSIYKDNTVYRPGAWLSTLPVFIPKGDTGYDLVTQVVATSKNATWDEEERTIKVNSKVTYQNLPCIRISNDTAFAMANGTFLGELTMKADRPVAVWNRPLPINGSKQLMFTSNIEQVWDGTAATGYAAGTGTKEDPYIIKTGAQLAYAVLNNNEGEWYKQLCDITLNRQLVKYEATYMGYNSSPTPLNWVNRVEWYSEIGSGNQVTWNASYDGGGHMIRGAMIYKGSALFGNIGEYGIVANLGVIDSYITTNSGLLANKMDGTIQNCIVQGLASPMHAHDEDSHMGYSGGICAIVGATNSNAIVEDCVSAMYSNCTLLDYTPFVSIPAADAEVQNHGKVRNCLAVVPTSFGDATFDFNYTADGHSFIENCYWLKGYEPTATGYTLDVIATALKSRSRWTCRNGYFPMLKTFANTNIGKLMTIPVRTDIDYDNPDYDQTLLGFDRQLTFEPGMAEWTSSNQYYVEADGDMGIVVPKEASYSYDGHYIPSTRYVLGQEQLVASLGEGIQRATIAIPVRTRRAAINEGISFVDPNAKQACLDAFDTDGNGILSLEELKAVTNDQTLTAFQTETALKIKQFPEFRFFKAVTELTTQLNGLSLLEEVTLPYALETLGSDAFDGCTSLTEVTIPGKVDVVEPHPFYGSAIENVYVDPFNENFVSRDGILFDTNDKLMAYPNGRSGEEIVLTGTIGEIAEGAIYKTDGLQRLYFETEDYETVPYLNYDGIVTDNGELIDVYVCDATYGSVLMQGYYDDGSWDEYVNAGKLHCYYPLKIGSAKAATMYIGFDTELPASLKPYIVTKANDSSASGEEGDEKNTAYLRKMSRKVPSRSPVVIFAEASGTYRLEPLDEELEPWKMYENLLNGVGRDGMRVYQGDSDRGSILTLGYNSSGILGFYYYKGERIAPYRAYLTHNEVSSGASYSLVFIEDDPSHISTIHAPLPMGDGNWYTLDGRRLSGKPTTKGVYIVNGRKVVVK